MFQNISWSVKVTEYKYIKLNYFSIIIDINIIYFIPNGPYSPMDYISPSISRMFTEYLSCSNKGVVLCNRRKLLIKLI